MKYGKYASFDDFLVTEISQRIVDAASKCNTAEELIASLYTPEWPTTPSVRTFREWLQRLRAANHDIPQLMDLLKPSIRPDLEPAASSKEQLTEHRLRATIAQLKREKKQLLDDFHELEVAADLKEAVGAMASRTIEFKSPNKAKSSQLMPWTGASDWHCAERVDPDTINDINEYDPGIARERAGRYFQRVAAQVALLGSKYKVETLGVWIGGDMISGAIHEDIAEMNELGPLGEAELLLDLWDSGLRYLLDYVPKIHVVTSSGNHGRITHQTRVATRDKYCLESFTYRRMRDRTQDLGDRVTWQINKGIIDYVDVFGYLHRFTHGDSLRFGGGIGGLVVPLRKRIAKWDEHRPAAYTILGHFHQLGYPRAAMTNGSLIGFNAYAQKIGAAPEPPQQLFWAIHPQIGRCYMSPIVCV